MQYIQKWKASCALRDQSAPLRLEDLPEFMRQEGINYINVSESNVDEGFVRVDGVGFTHIRRMITVQIHSGLGNRLFHLAFLYGIAKRTKSVPVLIDTWIEDVKIHTKDHWKYKPFYDMFPIISMPKKDMFEVIKEDPHRPGVYVDYQEVIYQKPFVKFAGYFQSDKYWTEYTQEIKSFFRSALGCDNVKDGYFLHVRGRDHMFKWDTMKDYYDQAKNKIKSDSTRHVLTDDVDFAEDLGFYQIQECEDDLSTLRFMASCTDGGVCCNSTFSWWGAFLGNGKQYVVPYPFNLKLDCKDIYTQDVIKVGIKDMTKSIVSVGYTNGEVCILFSDRIEECTVNNVKCDCRVYDHYSVCKGYVGSGEVALKIEVYGFNETYEDIIEGHVTTKHHLVAMTNIDDSVDVALLPSYVEYYTKVLGVEKLWVYVADTVDNSLCNYDDRVIYKEWKHDAYFAINDFLHYSKHITKYAIMTDVNEYIKWKLDIPLLEFMKTTEKLSCYAFMNRMTKLHNPIVDGYVYDRIIKDEYRSNDIVYTYGNRSRCIIKVDDIEVMGINKPEVVSTNRILDIGYTSGELLNVCNIQGKKNKNIDDRETRF